MYHRSTSAGAESMTGANVEMRATAAVDPLNALILLIKLECKRVGEQASSIGSGLKKYDMGMFTERNIYQKIMK